MGNVEQGLEVIGRIPYDEVVIEVMVQGKSVMEHSDSPAAQETRTAWIRVSEVLELEALQR